MAIYDSESSLKPSTVLKGKEPNAKYAFSLFYLSYGSKSGDTQVPQCSAVLHKFQKD